MSEIAKADDPGSLARDAYTYLHLPIIAGIIMVAVADDLLVAHPGDPLTTAGVVMATGGPAIFLLGEGAVRLRMIGRVSPTRMACVATLIVLALLGGEISALALTCAVAAALALLAISEIKRRPDRPSPSW
jgi:low temperature requirement protein LtrA